MNTEPIQDYILKSEHNLHIATAIVDALPEAREKIVTGFLKRLDARLKTRLKGWKSDREGSVYAERYASYCLWKPAWIDQYGLALQWGEYGKEMDVGVYRDKDHIEKRPFSDEL